jgi:hypothetical protein
VWLLEVKEDGMRRPMVVVVCALLVVAACGGSSNPEGAESPTITATGQGTPSTNTTAPSPSTTRTTEDTSGGGQTPEVGEASSFTVDDIEFAVTLLNRCIPFSDSPGNIDLQALAQGQGAKLNLVLLGETTEVSVDGGGIRERFGSRAFGKNPVVDASEVSGDRWTGSATVGDSMGSETTVEIAWDVMVPAEARDCGL